MITRTWLNLVGTVYGPGMAQPVDITHLNVPSVRPGVTQMNATSSNIRRWWRQG